MCSGSPGQECCYNAQGNLVVGSPGGGSVNRFVPYDFQNHVEEDLIPYLYCCPETCIDYFRCRPSDDGTNYKPPPPGNSLSVDIICLSYSRSPIYLVLLLL